MAQGLVVAARIDDLTVDVGQKLTADARNAFVKLIREEVARGRSLFHSQYEQAERGVILKYRKASGFDRFKTAYDVAKAKYDAAVATFSEQAETLGLTIEGEKAGLGYKPTPRQIAGVDKLQRMLDAIKANAPDQALESKLVARMYMATTMGEAVVILREVMGNGIMPTVSVSQLRGLPAPSQSGV